VGHAYSFVVFIISLIPVFLVHYTALNIGVVDYFIRVSFLHSVRAPKCFAGPFLSRYIVDASQRMQPYAYGSYIK